MKKSDQEINRIMLISTIMCVVLSFLLGSVLFDVPPLATITFGAFAGIITPFIGDA